MSAALSPPSIADIYTQHNGWLLRWLRGKLSCADQAADVAQETFLRLLTAPADAPSLREPRAYLTTVARRLVIDHYRHQSLMQAWHDTLAQLPEPLRRRRKTGSNCCKRWTGSTACSMAWARKCARRS